MALEIFQCGVTDEVAVLAVLGWAEGPASTVEGVVLHRDDTHGKEDVVNFGGPWTINTGLASATVANK
jgi:hypothetical protein